MKKIIATAAVLFAGVTANAATVTRTTISLDGVALTAANDYNSAASQTFRNDGRTIFYVNNQTASAVTLTFVTQASSVDIGGFGSVSLSNKEAGVPANTQKLFGPFPIVRWNNSSNQVAVNYTATGASVTVLPIQVPAE